MRVILEMIFASCVAVVMFSQVIAPLWKGKPLFPFFTRWGDAQQDLAEAREDVEVAHIERETEWLRDAARSVRSNPADTESADKGDDSHDATRVRRTRPGSQRQ